MIIPSDWMLRLMEWILKRLDLDLELADDGIIDSIDEEEVTEQLQFGRD